MGVEEENGVYTVEGVIRCDGGGHMPTYHWPIRTPIVLATVLV